MEYFFYCRDKPGVAAMRDELGEAHQSFMDGYAAGMIARGPTLAGDDLEAATGSMHIVDLRDADAARAFAFEEPNYEAGVYGDVLVRRWRNVLGRTMWEFAGDPENVPRFLAICHGRPDASGVDEALLQAQRDFMAADPFGNRPIVYGPLLSEDGSSWVGTALTIESPTRRAVERMLATDPFARAGLYDDIEIHRWRFGGRH